MSALCYIKASPTAVTAGTWLAAVAVRGCMAIVSLYHTIGSYNIRSLWGGKKKWK